MLRKQLILTRIYLPKTHSHSVLSAVFRQDLVPHTKTFNNYIKYKTMCYYHRANTLVNSNCVRELFSASKFVISFEFLQMPIPVAYV